MVLQKSRAFPSQTDRGRDFGLDGWACKRLVRVELLTWLWIIRLFISLFALFCGVLSAFAGRR